jgi:5'-nucleotidase
MSSRPLILLTNDDGVGAEGLIALRQCVAEFADVVVVAPATQQSATSHSITLVRPLRHVALCDDVHSVDGTPADCVYLALFEDRFLPRRPDLVLSGINHGTNLGSDVFYSGTVAGAREGAMRGIPAIAFSSASHDSFAACMPFVRDMTQRLLRCDKPIGQTVLLNVNFPESPSRGARPTTLGRQLYSERVTARRDPSGREYFWVGGSVVHESIPDGTDVAALRDGFISVTPLVLEATYVDHLGVAAVVAGPSTEDT